MVQKERRKVMASQKFTMIFREPVPLREGGYPGFNPQTEKLKGYFSPGERGEIPRSY
jgi:hypothetical protein